MESVTKIILFLILCLNIKLNLADEGLTTVLEEKLESKLSEYTNYMAKTLEEFNDQRLGNSEIGRMIRYNLLKLKFGIVPKAQDARNLKKMSMALIPLIFHVGATSTWMVLTSLMAAKSVGLGIILLVFKIAAGSAKVASFFTSMKTSSKQSDRHDWSWSPPHYEHHGARPRRLPSGSTEPGTVQVADQPDGQNIVFWPSMGDNIAVTEREVIQTGSNGVKEKRSIFGSDSPWAGYIGHE